MTPRRSVDELLAAGLPVEVSARGGSMWPAVRAGDRLRLEPGRTPRPGDLVAYRRGGVLVVHRVTRITSAGVFVRGDAAPGEEPMLARGEVLGVVTRHRTHDGLTLDHSSRLVHALDRAMARAQPLIRHPAKLLRRLVSAVRGGGAAAQPGGEGLDGVVGEEQVQGPARE